MLQVIQFDDTGKYGLRNTWTGIILTHEGEVREFATPEEALEFANSLTTELNDLIREVQIDDQRH